MAHETDGLFGASTEDAPNSPSISWAIEYPHLWTIWGIYRRRWLVASKSHENSESWEFVD